METEFGIDGDATRVRVSENRKRWCSCNIREVVGSSLTGGTGCPDGGFPWFASVPEGKCQDCIARQLPYHPTLYGLDRLDAARVVK